MLLASSTSRRKLHRLPNCAAGTFCVKKVRGQHVYSEQGTGEFQQIDVGDSTRAVAAGPPVGGRNS